MNPPAASDRPCPGWGDLLEYRFESSARQEQLRAHVSGCLACQRTLAELGCSGSDDAPGQIAALPERFWDDQRRAIMAKLPCARDRRSAFRLWPALAASFCTALLGLGLLWQFGGVSHQRARPAAARQVNSDGEDRFLNTLIDRATASPSREWIDSLTGDPELRSIREVYGVGDTL
jgi:hypothetical protein